MFLLCAAAFCGCHRSHRWLCAWLHDSIGLAIALAAAKDGANVAIVAKTTKPHPKLPGTIYTAAEEVEKAGGKAIAICCDIRSEEQVQAAVNQTVDAFGGIDILVNNASAINLSPTERTDMKRCVPHA